MALNFLEMNAMPKKFKYYERFIGNKDDEIKKNIKISLSPKLKTNFML